MAITVTTPRGQIIRTTTKSGAVKAELSWNPNFAPQKSQNFTRAQKFVDSEVLRYCSATARTELNGDSLRSRTARISTETPHTTVTKVNTTNEHSG